MSENTIHDTIIIGSGPAGYTAAIYAARAGLSPIVFEGYETGGLLMTTTEVENFPGFPDGVQGPELMERMRTQAKRVGADLRTEMVETVTTHGPVKEVVAEGVTYLTRTVILATGSAPRTLGIPGESEFTGRGVSTCATCDGFFFTDKHVAVVGGGDSAMEEALFLSRVASNVTLFHRSHSFRASPVLVDRVRANEKITMVLGVTVDEVHGDGTGVNSITTRSAVTGDTAQVDVSALFVAIGHDPRSGFLNGQLDTDDNGYVLVEGDSTRTSQTGVFACGDLVDHTYRQAVTAAGTGARAAIDAWNHLSSSPH